MNRLVSEIARPPFTSASTAMTLGDQLAIEQRTWGGFDLSAELTH
jgi:hypothetical protein